MIKHPIFVLVIILLCASSCNETYLVKKQCRIFSDQDYEEIAIIRRSFDSALVNNRFSADTTLSFIERYFTFIDTASSAQEAVSRHVDFFDIHSLVKYCKRIQGLPVYNKIWGTSITFDPYNKDIADTILVYNVNGKYMGFLKCLYYKDSKKYPFYNQISLAGGGYIPPVTVANFQKMTLLYYFDTNYREVIVPIHYFSIILNELSRRHLIVL